MSIAADSNAYLIAVEHCLAIRISEYPLNEKDEGFCAASLGGRTLNVHKVPDVILLLIEGGRCRGGVSVHRRSVHRVFVRLFSRRLRSLHGVHRLHQIVLGVQERLGLEDIAVAAVFVTNLQDGFNQGNVLREKKFFSYLDELGL